MATPGLTPVAGATTLRVSDAHTREDGRSSKQRPSPPRERRSSVGHAPDADTGDSFTHADADGQHTDDRAEQVRRLLERAMARAAVELSEATTSAGPNAPARLPAAAAEVAARYRSDAPTEPTPHAIDTLG